MECQFPSQTMRSSRGILSPYYARMPTTCLMIIPVNKSPTFSRVPFLLSARPCSTSGAVETNNPLGKKLKCERLYLFEKTPGRVFGYRDRKDKSNVRLDVEHRLKRYSEMLRDCTLGRSVNEGKAIHCKIVRTGIDPDSHLWVSLINFYAKCGCLSVARRVFDVMPERDVVSWTALIGGFVAEGYGRESVNLVCQMCKEGILPNGFTLATALKACSMCLDAEFGKQLHGEIVKLGLFSDVYVGSALVDLYAKCGEMEYAEKVFFFMPEQNDVSWNALLNGYAQVGDGEEILRLVRSMKETEMKFNTHTLSTLLKGCANSGNLKAGQLVHGLVIKIGSESDEFISCSLLDVYSKCGLADDAFKVFSMINHPDIVTWSAMICCLEQQGRIHKAVEVFCDMLYSGLKPNQFTLESIVNAAKDLGDPRFCGSIHACVYKYGFEAEDLVSKALITMYMKTGSVYDGIKVFNSISHLDVVLWNTLLSGFHDGESSDQGPKTFKNMVVQGFKPNMYTFISILRSCSSLSDLIFGKQVHAQIIKDSLASDGYVGTALIDMYAKSRCMEDVENIFSRLNERDLFTWTVIIAGYAQTDQGEKAIHYFSKMRKQGVKPNEFTLASCLKGCSRIASLENGRLIHSLAIKAGHFSDTFVASALVDMYGKCGCIDDAEIIFKVMDSHDTVLWNTIICQYSQHGKGERALEAFDNMLDKGVSPDGVTFVGILCACSHMGSVELGKKHFYSMSEIYGITPCMEHYACMVDILGRAGKFNELENFIERMTIAPDGSIWETVLGACKVHGNVELAQRAAEKLFQIEPEVDSNYIMLSNIFAAKGMWDNVSQIRSLMSSQGVKKEPGCSWVEVGAKTHVFLSQDASHQSIQAIHQKLDELGRKLSSVGYIPNTDYVLHNVSDKEKKENLSYHSERLALAFSLLNNTSTKTVRIFKNLRICGDCHEYMKLASGILNKDITVRDAKQFHHFSKSSCSCQGYW